MRPEDLALLHTVGDPDVHPDGERIVVTVARPDLDQDTYVRALHLVGTDGSSRRFTAGPRDARGRFSPDGTQLAFLRSPEKGKPAQVAIVPVDGGEAEVVTELPMGAGDHVWSPDGRWLVVTGSVRLPELADLDDDERARRPRRITGLGFRWESRGWLHDQHVQLWLVDATGEQEPRQLTDAPFDHGSPAFTLDGTAVLCMSAQQDDAENSPEAQVWRIPLDGEEPEAVTAPGGWGAPVALAGGGFLTVGHVSSYEWPAPAGLHRHDVDGGVSEVLPDLDRDISGLPGRGPTVLADGSVLLVVEDRGAVQLVRTTADGRHDVLVGGAQMVTGAAATPDGGTVAYTATHPTDPGELWVLDGGEPRVLTSFNEELRGQLLPVEHFAFERDGQELDAWVLLPEGDGEDLPLLFNIHGGPTAQYGHYFFDEFQVEARAGYAVVGINPRGSSGRGAAFSTAVVGDWPNEDSVDVLDLEAVVDAVLARHPQISPERVGIMGGSYGGYATARLLARTDRYASAIVERGLLNWVSFAGTSDIGSYFDRMFVGTQMPEGIDALWAASPVRTADRISTPTLVLHSFEDHRCPPEQAYQLFSMLRRNGVESELLLFPDESHELSRSGSPKHRVERFEAVLAWHDRHLGVERPTADATEEEAATG